jgi:hypothetical protein
MKSSGKIFLTFVSLRSEKIGTNLLVDIGVEDEDNGNILRAFLFRVGVQLAIFFQLLLQDWIQGVRQLLNYDYTRLTFDHF